MDLSISGFVEKPRERIFLWSKLSNEDRIERLELIFKDENVPVAQISKLAQDYNSIYLKGKKTKEEIWYAKLDKSSLVDKVTRYLMLNNFAIPIVYDEKKYYKQTQIPSHYDPKFNKLIDNENELVTLEKKPQPYLILVKKSPDIISDETNFLHDFIINNAHISIRFADMTKSKKLLDYDSEFNSDNLFDINVLTNTANIVGIYINTCFNFNDNISINQASLFFDQAHKIEYINNKLYESETYHDNLQDLFQQDLEKCHGIRYVSLNSDYIGHADNSWANLSENLLQLLYDKKNDIESDYYNKKFTEIKLKIADDNTKFSKQALDIINNNIKSVNKNLINYLFFISAHGFLYHMVEALKLIIANELNICVNANKKEINNKIKMILAVEKSGQSPIRLYDKICKSNKLNTHHQYSLVCHKLNRTDIVTYRYYTLKELIKKYNKYLRDIVEQNTKEKSIEKINNIMIKKHYKHDIYVWYIKTSLGEDVLKKILEKSKKVGVYINDVITEKQKKTITNLITSLKKQQQMITKLMQEKDLHPGIRLRITYDTSKDEEQKFNALRKLVKYYIEDSPGNDMQYKLKDVDYEILCEHEKILLQMHNALDESQIQKYKYILETKFYSEATDSDAEVYISCRYCGRPIARSTLKVYDTYQKTTGFKNVGYGKIAVSIIDTKTMKQIAYILEVARLVIKDRISYAITPESIYNSIGDFIRQYLGKEKIHFTSAMRDVDDFSISPLMDRIIASFAIAKIIYEIIRSYGNIYPVGSRNIVEELLMKKGEDKALLDYLIEWGFKKLKKLSYLGKKELKNREKNIKILTQIYNKIKKREIHVASNVIETPQSYKINDKYDKEIKQLTDILTDDYKREDFISIQQYKKLSRYSEHELQNIYKYFIKKSLVTYNENIDKVPINKKFSDILDLSKLSMKNTVHAREIKKYNFCTHFDTYEYNLDPFWANYYVNLMKMSKIQIYQQYNKKFAFVTKQFIKTNRKHEILDRLDVPHKKQLNDIINRMKKSEMTVKQLAHIYFTNRCLDNTPHFFYGRVCINCGQTSENIEKPSKHYMELMVKTFNSITKKEQTQIFTTKKIKNMILEHVNKEKKVYTKYMRYEFDVHIKNIVKFLISYHKINTKTTKFSSRVIRKFLAKNDLAYLADALSGLGRLTRRHNEEKRSEKSLLHLKNKYRRLRLVELKKYIKIIIEYYSILRYTKHLDLLKVFRDSDFLIKYMENGMTLTENISIDSEFISKIYDDKNLSYGDKTKLLLSIFIDIVNTILTKNPKRVTGERLSTSDISRRNNKSLLRKQKYTNITLLSNFMIEMLDRIFYSQQVTDTTIKDFELSDIDADFKAYRKRQKFLTMSMQEKIESGVLSMTYEQQEELHKDLYLDLDTSNVQFIPIHTKDTAQEYFHYGPNGPIDFNDTEADYDIDPDDIPDLRDEQD